MNRLIQMIISSVLRNVVKRGVDSGINRLTGGSTGDPKAQSSLNSKDLVRKARQAANLARRLGR